MVGVLPFGGQKIEMPSGVPVDLIVREDEYKGLYEEALRSAICTEDGQPIVRPEYLAAMKFAARRPKDNADLIFLLQQPDLLDRKLVREVVYRMVGGRFAAEEFDSVVAEADFLQSKERS